MSQNAFVLYVDHQGHPAPLTECFHATASRRLSSSIPDRFPPSTITEVDSAYCPHCLSFQDVASAVRQLYCIKPACQRCPICTTVLTVVPQVEANTATAKSSSTSTSGDNADSNPPFYVCCYQCGNCQWTSKECHLTAPLEVVDGEMIGKLELARAAEELGTTLNQRRTLEPRQQLNSYAAHVHETWKHYGKPTRTGRVTGIGTGAAAGITAAGGGSTSQYPRLPLSSLPKLDRPEGWSLEMLEKSLGLKREQRYALGSPEWPTLDGMIKVERILSLDMELKPLDESLADLSLHVLHSQILPWTIHHRQDLLPLPIPLRVRRSRRCRAELAEGRPGILLKPKLNPLEGDSSLRTGHGQWWRKDSSAAHIIPRVRVLKYVKTDISIIFLLKVVNPTLGTMRLRFSSSQYRGEPSWDDSSQPNESLDALLTDTVTQTRWNVQLWPWALEGALNTTEVVELLSAEDSIIEMGGKARETPDAVVNWAAPDQSPSEACMRLVAQYASDAWFELCIPARSDQDINRKPAIPLDLQIELGNGSWESSLIPPSPGVTDDWISFDLIVTWE